MKVLKLSQYIRKILFLRLIRREHGWTIAEPRVESWGGGVWEELFHPSLPVFNVSNVDCFSKHIFCQLHPLCPAFRHSHLGKHYSVFGTISCTPTHITLDGVFTSIHWMRYILKYIHVLKEYLCTHTYARAHIAQEAYVNSENFRGSPSASWQLEAWFNFQGWLFPLSQASSICLLTLSCTFYLLGSRAAYIKRADLTTYSMLALAAQLSPHHFGHAWYLMMLWSQQYALSHCVGFPLGCHLFPNSLHTSLTGEMEKASWHHSHESRPQVQEWSGHF